MALNIGTLVLTFLQNSTDSKFTTRQIAEWIFRTYPEECQQKRERSRASVFPLDTDTALIGQIAAEISSQGQQLQRKHPQIKTTEGRPRKYYFTSQTDSDEVNSAESANTGDQAATGQPGILNEHALYPKLAEFLYTDLGVYSKRIDERRAKNTQGAGGNKWLFPDLVGMEDLSGDWHPEIRKCVEEYSARRTKLWSFEVKLLVNRSNVREVFFQTVSNSSWANFAYLVASEIEGRETIKELRILTSLHGIGVIQLNADNPSESEILIPARERNEVDWNTANRLVKENPDFRDYIELIREFYQTGNPRIKNWAYRPDSA